MNKAPYQWQKQQWHHVCRMIKQERVPESLLLTGMKGIGLLEFAKQFVQLFFCQTTSSEKPCFSCARCLQVMDNSYPDLLLIHSNSKPIPIEEVRNVSNWLSLSSFLNQQKIVILNSIDRMTLSASNALLKTLEEPPTHSLLILISHSRLTIPRTIKSRCIEIRFPVPSFNDFNNHLDALPITCEERYFLSLISKDAPILAKIEYERNRHLDFKNIFEAVYSFIMHPHSNLIDLKIINSIDIKILIEYIMFIMIDLIRTHLRCININNIDKKYYECLINMTKRLKLESLFQTYDKLLITYKEVAILNIIPNKIVLIDSLLFDMLS